MDEGAQALLAVLRDLIAARPRQPDAPPPDEAAIAVLAAMNGGLQLARALADHPARSATALRAAAALARKAAA